MGMYLIIKYHDARSREPRIIELVKGKAEVLQFNRGDFTVEVVGTNE